MALETLLASVVLPALIDIVKSVGSATARRVVGLSVDDQIKLQTAETAKLEAISRLDNPHGTPSQWVVDLRQSFRYIAAAVVIVVGGVVAGIGAYTHNQAVTLLGAELAGTPFGFIFGERMWLGFKGPMSK